MLITRRAIEDHRPPPRPNGVSHSISENVTKFMDPLCDSDPLQNLRGSSLANATGTSFLFMRLHENRVGRFCAILLWTNQAHQKHNLLGKG